MFIASWWMVSVQSEHFTLIYLYHNLLKSIPTFSLISFSSSAFSTSFHLARVKCLRFVQSDAKCPSPKHLKHIWMPVGRGLGVGCGGRLCCGVWLFCGMGETDAVGLGVEDELPFFTV